MKHSVARLLFAAILALPGVSLAQTVVARTITFTGTEQPQSELLTLSGLTPGKTYTKDDLEAAAARLDASGLFSSVQYQVTAGTLTFALEPFARARMQTVHYVNFPWFTQDQLTAAVQAHLPLFTGSVPSTGDLQTQVTEALTAIVKARGVTATIEAQGVAGGRLDYRIVSPPVQVTALEIENIRWESDPVLRSVHDAMVNIEYLEGVSERGVHDNLAYALQELGFLDAEVGAVSHAQPAVEPNRISVVMTGEATPNPRYKVASVTFPAPQGAITQHELETSDFQVRAGGLPSPSLVKNTVARMAFVFQNHGFLDATSSVSTNKDQVAHTVSYTFAVAPGDAYRMRDLLFAPDLTPDQQSQLKAAWKLPSGVTYEGDTAQRTLLSLKTLCSGRPAAQKLMPDHATHQVDVSLSCRPQRAVGP